MGPLAVKAAIGVIQTLADMLVTDDRLPPVEAKARAAVTGAKADTGALALYSRGPGKFSQMLEKVDPQPQIEEALAEIGRLAKPDTSIDTLIQASAQANGGDTSSLKSLAVVQKSIQDGGARLHQAYRLGLNLDAKS